MKPIITASILLILGCGSQSCGSSSSSDSEHAARKENKEILPDEEQKDARFAVSALSGGMLEVKLGALAQSNAADPEVKAFGKGMVDDHSQANSELTTLAQQKNIALPAVPGDHEQSVIDELKQKSGADFDKAYIAYMVDDHKKDIDAFTKEADNGHDPEFKSWAAAKLPILEHHLMMAEMIKEKLK